MTINKKDLKTVTRKEELMKEYFTGDTSNVKPVTKEEKLWKYACENKSEGKDGLGIKNITGAMGGTGGKDLTLTFTMDDNTTKTVTVTLPIA